MTDKSKKWVRGVYYALVCTALAVAAVLLMVQCVAIYRLGDSPFTRERIAEYFAPIAVPVYVCIGLVAVGFALSPLLPAAPDDQPDRDAVTLRRLQDKTDLSACPTEIGTPILRLRRGRLLHHNITLILLAIGTAVFLWYALDVNRFSLQDATGSMVSAMWVLLPCVGVPFLYAVVTAYLCRSSVRKEIALLRVAQYEQVATQMEEQDEKDAVVTDSKYKKKKTVKTADNERMVPVVRGVVLAAAVGLIVYGLLYNGAVDVLWKAVNICQECIGLG